MSRAKKVIVPRVKHPFFRGMSDAFRNQITKLGKFIETAKGETVFRDGGKADYFFLILKGKVDLIGVEQDIRFETESEKRLFHTLGAGDVVGWSWAITPYRWRFDAVVAQNAELLAIDGVRLRRAMQIDHELGYEVYKRLIPIMNQRLIASRLKLQMFGAKPFASAEGG